VCFLCFVALIICNLGRFVGSLPFRSIPAPLFPPEINIIFYELLFFLCRGSKVTPYSSLPSASVARRTSFFPPFPGMRMAPPHKTEWLLLPGGLVKLGRSPSLFAPRGNTTSRFPPSPRRSDLPDAPARPLHHSCLSAFLPFLGERSIARLFCPGVRRALTLWSFTAGA